MHSDVTSLQCHQARGQNLWGDGLKYSNIYPGIHKCLKSCLMGTPPLPQRKKQSLMTDAVTYRIIREAACNISAPITSSQVTATLRNHLTPSQLYFLSHYHNLSKHSNLTYIYTLTLQIPVDSPTSSPFCGKTHYYMLKAFLRHVILFGTGRRELGVFWLFHIFPSKK